MDALDDIVARAIQAQQQHQALINSTIDKVERAGDGAAGLRALQDGIDAVANLRGSYWQTEVFQNIPDLTIPAALSSTDPQQAVIRAVYYDMGDTEQKWMNVHQQRNFQTLYRKAVNQSWPSALPKLPDFPSPPDLTMVAIAVGFVALALLFRR